MHIANLSTIKVMESNCYSLACAKASVFQTPLICFLRDQQEVWRHLDISRSVWLWIRMLQQNSIQLCRWTGLSRHDPRQLDQKHCIFLPQPLSLPPSSHPSSPTISVPFLTLTQMWGKKLRGKRAFLVTVKIVKVFNIYQGSHYSNIWCHRQRSMFSQAGIPGLTWTWVHLQQSAHKFGATPNPWSYCTSSCFSSPVPRQLHPS